MPTLSGIQNLLSSIFCYSKNQKQELEKEKMPGQGPKSLVILAKTAPLGEQAMETKTQRRLKGKRKQVEFPNEMKN